MAGQTMTPQQMTNLWLAGTNQIQVVQGSMTYGQKNPIRMEGSDYIAQVVQKTSLVYTFANSTAATATVPLVDGDWPYSAVGDTKFVSNTVKTIWGLSGSQAYWQEKFSEPAWVDTVTNVTASADAIPASGTATLTVDVYTKISLSQSLMDLTGLYLASAKGEVATVSQDWVSKANLADAFSLPAGVTITGITGTVELGQIQYASVASGGAPVVPLMYVAKQHRTKSLIDMSLAGATTASETLKMPGTLLRLGMILYTADGYRDIGNSLGLQKIEMQYGSAAFPVRIDEDFQRFFGQEQHRMRRWTQNDVQDRGLAGTFLTALAPTQGPQGVYVIDNTANAANLVNLSNYPEHSVYLNLEFSSAPPLNSVAAIWAETVLPLTEASQG